MTIPSARHRYSRYHATWAPIASAVLVVLMAATASAHHAGTAYDQSKRLELQGTVSKFEFVNPHAYVYFSVQDAKGGQQSWRCELSAAGTLARLGWTKATFTVGQKVLFKGAAGRNEDNVCVLNSFVPDGGQELSAREDLTKGGPNPVATLAKSSMRPARLPSGRPNLAGPWLGPGNALRGGGPPGSPGGPGARGLRDGGPGPGLAQGGPPPGAGPRRGGGPEVTAAGIAAAAHYNQPFDDPAIKCDIGNIMFGWTHDGHVNEIVQNDKEITLKYGYMDFVRTIHLDQPEHPKNIKPSRGGHSIGKWDGDVLVVDTIGLSPGVLNPMAGVMHSDRMHVVERFSLDPTAGTLTHEYTATDPLYLKAPLTGRDVSTISAESFVPYNCKELSGRNNMRPKS